MCSVQNNDESFPLAGDTDGSCTTECDNGDQSDEIKQESLPFVKQEPVCCCFYLYLFQCIVDSFFIIAQLCSCLN